jgi:hypothetical protein
VNRIGLKKARLGYWKEKDHEKAQKLYKTELPLFQFLFERIYNVLTLFSTLCALACYSFKKTFSNKKPFKTVNNCKKVATLKFVKKGLK